MHWRRTLAVLAALLWADWCAAQLVAYQRQGNPFDMTLSDGSAKLEWISSSAFRFCRHWTPDRTGCQPVRQEPTPVDVRDGAQQLEFVTQYLRVTVAKENLRLAVYDREDRLLMADAAAPQWTGSQIILEREFAEDERFCGLGVEGFTEGEFSRGRKVTTGTAFLISTRGYGEYVVHPGRAVYEFGARRRIEVPGRRSVEFFFYYGPSPKEILEEHATVSAGLAPLDSGDVSSLSRVPQGAVLLPAMRAGWEGMRQVVRNVLRASCSALLLPAVDVTACLEGPQELRRRALALASYLPLVVVRGSANAWPEGMWLFEQRRRLAPYLVSYVYEAQERGFPLVRPLAMQYPKDAEARRQEDEFFLGDELLVAPIVGPDARRRVYLPMGIWTELHTNRRYRGRQTVEVEAGPDWIPVFVRNGSILPLAPAVENDLMQLHYFPRLAAEFFLYEEKTGALTQFHAAPAGELLRLEIEPAAERAYEWIVHHVGPPSAVRVAGREYNEVRTRRDLAPGRWWHDEKGGNLHIQTRAAAGAHHLIHIAF